jgi:hypothetical protein
MKSSAGAFETVDILQHERYWFFAITTVIRWEIVPGGNPARPGFGSPSFRANLTGLQGSNRVGGPICASYARRTPTSNRRFARYKDLVLRLLGTFLKDRGTMEVAPSMVGKA